MITNNPENTEKLEEYSISVEEAIEILSCSKPRLSQLTSKGVFSFQKKRIGDRTRTFYRSAELLEYKSNKYDVSIKTYPVPYGVERNFSMENSVFNSIENKALNASNSKLNSLENAYSSAVEFKIKNKEIQSKKTLQSAKDLQIKMQQSQTNDQLIENTSAILNKIHELTELFNNKINRISLKLEKLESGITPKNNIKLNKSTLSQFEQAGVSNKKEVTKRRKHIPLGIKGIKSSIKVSVKFQEISKYFNQPKTKQRKTITRSYAKRVKLEN